MTEWAGFIAVASAGMLLTAVKYPVRGPVGMRALAFSLLALPPGLLILLSMVKPYYVDRYVVYCMCGLALLVGAVADWAVGPEGIRHIFPHPPYRWAAVAVVPAVLAAVLAPWHTAMRSPEARKDNAFAVSTAVREVAEPGDTVLFTPSRRRDWLLHSPVPYRMLDDIALKETPEKSGTLHGIEYPAGDIRERIAAADRIIALADPEGQPLDETPQETVKRDALGKHFNDCRTITVHGARVTVWARSCGTDKGTGVMAEKLLFNRT
ncbi:hypothetical protein [Streptomyces gobiensis]|uniref:hypothetical protein n=1 Tax=Streptomyces gobiensis TaxID=2875706 RepID=UPI001E552084|nr:hypothetical protein [Streptomyces gobiensis]UGY92785.1 hypothetical protein test1122_14380 [Streptomyces gobiensis]